MAPKPRNLNERRRSERNGPTPLTKAGAGSRDPFYRWLTIILAFHVVGLTLLFFALRKKSPADSPLELTVAPPPERTEDQRSQQRFLELFKREPERLPVIASRPDLNESASDIVLPDAELQADLRRMEELAQEKEAETEQRLKELREAREKMEAEAEAIAEAERQRVAAEERERIRKEQQAKENKRAEELAAKKREQERLAREKKQAEQKAEAERRAMAERKAKADAEAKREAAARAEAARIAAANRSGNASGQGGQGSNSGGGSGGTETADMNWYNNAVLGPAFYNAWSQPAGPDFSGRNYSVAVRVVVRKDGQIVSATITRSSGNNAVDASVRAALSRVTRLSPLPRAYRQETYSETIHFTLDS